MKTNPEILVTLSDELMVQLRAQARRLEVPLKWLVAGMVCDTIETTEGETLSTNKAMCQRCPVAHVA